MRIFDASSIIYAWDNYPIGIFPRLWDWIAEEVNSQNIVISTVALDEVSHVSPECGMWLKDNEINQIPVSNSILNTAMEIKEKLGITDDNYNSKGVGENDILIIASAKIIGAELVSDEEFQNNLPPTLARYKIPATCKLPSVSVSCINFLGLIKNSGSTF